MRLHLDFETRSHLDLSEVGSYAYCNHWSTEITHAAWKIDGQKETKLFQLHRGGPNTLEELYSNLGEAAWSGNRNIVAHNASFEYQVCAFVLSRIVGQPNDVLAPSHFDCTMARGYNMGLPGQLEKCAQAIGLRMSKDKYGSAMMKKHCKPCPYTKPDGSPMYWTELDEGTYVEQELAAYVAKLDARARPVKDRAAAIEKKRAELVPAFRAFDFDAELDAEGAYCAQDVELEIAIDRWVLPLTDDEFETWCLDQKINMAGIPIDIPRVTLLNEAVQKILARADHDIDKVTDGEINRVTQAVAIAKWLRERGIPCDGLGKDKIENLLQCAALLEDDTAAEVIRLRAMGGQTAVNKLPPMLATSDELGISRNVFQYHGAATGRWSGRLWQPHNMKRLPDGAVERLEGLLAYGGGADGLIMAAEALDIDLFGAIGDAMRSLLYAEEGSYWVGGDFSNIEGRGNAWLADERWKIQAFIDYDKGIGSDLYKLAYARAFRLHPDEVDKAGRQKGKVLELSMGYGGGVGAFQNMAKNYRLFLSDKEADDLKVKWREAHPCIVDGWAALKNAALDAIRRPGTKQVCFDGKVLYYYDGNHLICKVPKGGFLMYPFAQLKRRPKQPPVEMTPEEQADWTVENADSGDWAVCYQGVRGGSFGDKYLYGGLQCENLCQRIARDVMADKMKAADKARFSIRLHVHDEIQCIDKDPGREAELKAIMVEPLKWCPGYPIAAECGVDRRYVK